MMTANVHVAKIRSPLLEALKLESFKPKSRGSKRTRKVVAALVLTSLVDAFAIMLLYLLVQGSGNGSTLELNNASRLPIATEATALHDGTLVRIEGQRYFIGNQAVDEVALAAKLQEIRSVDKSADASLIVQADRDADFARLATVIRAGSVSGFHNFKFAVLHEGAN